MADPVGAEAYARAVERMLEGAEDCSFIVSRRDFEKIEGWRLEGIPLAFVEEQWRELQRSHRPHRGRTPRLQKLARVVDEAWAVVRDGQRTSHLLSAWGDVGEDSDATHEWVPPAGEEITPELDRLVREVLAAREEGADEEALDRRIDRELAAVVPRPMLDKVRTEVELELREYRNRMPAEKLLSTAERAVTDRLRRKLRLPRLAHRHPG